MVTNKKIKVVDDVIKVPEKKYITTDGMEFIDLSRIPRPQ